MKTFLPLLALVAALGLTGCGGDGGEAASDAGTPASEAGLSAAQLEHGIGPVEALTLGELRPDLAAEGQAIFDMKCTACHKMDQRYVGPALGDVLERRSPAFVMNMILNPAEMVQQHPEARAMLAQFMTPMPNQSLTEEEARAVVEYLRTVQADAAP